MQEIVRMLKGDPAYKRVGAKTPKGIIFQGPPGTGKTYLARAIAGEAGVPFFASVGSEFVEMYAGVAAARVNSLFYNARQKSPSIIFIDEVRAVHARAVRAWVVCVPACMRPRSPVGGRGCGCGCLRAFIWYRPLIGGRGRVGFWMGVWTGALATGSCRALGVMRYRPQRRCPRHTPPLLLLLLLVVWRPRARAD